MRSEVKNTLLHFEHQKQLKASNLQPLLTQQIAEVLLRFFKHIRGYIPAALTATGQKINNNHNEENPRKRRIAEMTSTRGNHFQVSLLRVIFHIRI